MPKEWIAEPDHYWIPVDNGEWFCSCRWRPNYYSETPYQEQAAVHRREVESGANMFVAVPCETCKGTCVQKSANGFEHYCLPCQGSGVKAPN